jgi:hypothetical protein
MTPCDGEVSSTQVHLLMARVKQMVSLLRLAKYVLKIWHLLMSRTNDVPFMPSLTKSVFWGCDYF